MNIHFFRLYNCEGSENSKNISCFISKLQSTKNFDWVHNAWWSEWWRAACPPTWQVARDISSGELLFFPHTLLISRELLNLNIDKFQVLSWSVWTQFTDVKLCNTFSYSIIFVYNWMLMWSTELIDAQYDFQGCKAHLKRINNYNNACWNSGKQIILLSKNKYLPRNQLCLCWVSVADLEKSGDSWLY